MVRTNQRTMKNSQSTLFVFLSFFPNKDLTWGCLRLRFKRQLPSIIEPKRADNNNQHLQAVAKKVFQFYRQRTAKRMVIHGGNTVTCAKTPRIEGMFVKKP